MEIRRAKRFYKEHAGVLGRFLSASELEYVRERDSYRRLAMVFAAREAVFKATGRSLWRFSSFEKVSFIQKPGYVIASAIRTSADGRSKVR